LGSFKSLLTLEQEIEILRPVSQSTTNQELATALFHDQTIKNKLSVIFQKRHVNNGAEAIASAIWEGLIPAG